MLTYIAHRSQYDSSAISLLPREQVYYWVALHEIQRATAAPNGMISIACMLGE